MHRALSSHSSKRHFCCNNQTTHVPYRSSPAPLCIILLQCPNIFYISSSSIHYPTPWPCSLHPVPQSCPSTPLVLSHTRWARRRRARVYSTCPSSSWLCGTISRHRRLRRATPRWRPPSRYTAAPSLVVSRP